MASHNGSLLYHPDSAGHHIFDLNLALIIVSTIFVFLRLFVRGVLVKALGWDDLIATIAWALGVTLSALEMDTTHYGTGAQIKDVPLETLHQFSMRLTIMELIYFIASGAVRLAILAFLPRLSKNRVYMWCIYGLSLIVVTVSLTGVFFMLTECSQIPDVFNYDASWRQCRDEREERLMVLSQSIIWIFVDCMLVALPLWVVTSYLKMGVNAIQILLVFSVGIFAVATGIARTVIILTTDFSDNTTYKMLPIATWTDAEVHVGLWVGCFPALQPLIRHASFMMGLRGQPHSTVRRSRRDTAMSTDTPNKRSVVNRSSHGSSHLWSGRSENQPKGSLTKGIEMVDLEKGKDSRRIIDQRNIMVDIDLSDTPNATNAENKGQS
ncbi:hypothetical protein LZ31DRAFT_474877 [Colletotrichum somersetense]|nr:hypothetical protein LZ31DRAFT_474877 [Colletotrichum somersetense]